MPSNAFEAHGIDHLSPTSLNVWAMSPALWVMERLLKQKVPVSCAAHRGSAVEHGVTLGLQHPDLTLGECQQAALRKYDELAAFSGDPRRQKHRDDVPDTVSTALLELRHYGRPDRVQERVERRLPEVPVPLVGYLDFGWSQHGFIADLKTSEKLPSEISDAHARQGAMYCADSNYEMRFAYATPKKIGVYILQEPQRHVRDLVVIAKRLEKFLALSCDPQELAGLLVPDLTHFVFNDPVARAHARRCFGFEAEAAGGLAATAGALVEG
jgi:hypothetical protein